MIIKHTVVFIIIHGHIGQRRIAPFEIECTRRISTVASSIDLYDCIRGSDAQKTSAPVVVIKLVVTLVADYQLPNFFALINDR